MIHAAENFRRRQLTPLAVAIGLVGLASATAGGQSTASLLTSRAELTVAAERAELAAASGNGATRNALLAASIRSRLRDGDFQPGDRVVVSVLAETLHTDTLVVRSGRILELPGKIALPVSGVLRSELEGRVTTEILKYVKAQQVTVVPLTRIGVLGEVARPGYFALPSDVPITDAIMAAGGPTASADVERTIVRRGTQELRSTDETRLAVSRGMTIDQFGLSAGDELVVGRQRDFFGTRVLGTLGAIGSLTAIFVALRH